MWSSSLAVLRDRAGLDDAGLGAVLLGIGGGALIATTLTGRAVDRLGARVSGVFLVVFALAAVLTVLAGGTTAAFAVGVALIGFTSGAADVSVNALAGLVEARTGTRVIARSHACFSAGVVLGSLGAAGAAALAVPIEAVFVALALVIAAVGLLLALTGGRAHAPRDGAGRGRTRWAAAMPFVVVGVVGALALMVESAHESWSAVFLTDVLRAGRGLPPLAPAVFALGLSAGRLAYAALGGLRTGVVVLVGSAVAGAGTVLLAVAPSVPVALAAVAVAALGLAAVFPALLSEAVRDVPLDRRGRATSVVAITAYFGFLAAPALIGAVSGAVDLRAAMLTIAAVALAAGVGGAAVVRSRGRRERVGG